MKIIEFILPFQFPTVNTLYGMNHNRRFLRPEGKLLRANIVNKIKSIMDQEQINLKDYDNTELISEITVYDRWYSKTGKILKKDISNKEKFLVDSIFEGLGLDDHLIFTNILHKQHEADPENYKALVTISVKNK